MRPNEILPQKGHQPFLEEWGRMESLSCPCLMFLLTNFPDASILGQRSICEDSLVRDLLNFTKPFCIVWKYESLGQINLKSHSCAKHGRGNANTHLEDPCSIHFLSPSCSSPQGPQQMPTRSVSICAEHRDGSQDALSTRAPIVLQ